MKYLHTSMHTVTSDNERTEQNGKPHSNPSLVIASYGPAPNYYCEWRDFAIMMTLRNSEAEVPTA